MKSNFELIGEFTGKIISDEQKEKLRIANSEKKQTEAHKQKISKAEKEKTNFDLIQDFHEAFDNGYKDPEIKNQERILLRGKLMLEELLEVFDELGLEIFCDYDNENPSVRFQPKAQTFKINKAKVGKELADLLYVTYGSGDTMDIPMDEVYREVHRSNMSKLGADGKPVRREDGKILKGPDYSPANIESVLKAKS